MTSKIAIIREGGRMHVLLFLLGTVVVLVFIGIILLVRDISYRYPGAIYGYILGIVSLGLVFLVLKAVESLINFAEF